MDLDQILVSIVAEIRPFMEGVKRASEFARRELSKISQVTIGLAAAPGRAIGAGVKQGIQSGLMASRGAMGSMTHDVAMALDQALVQSVTRYGKNLGIMTRRGVQYLYRRGEGGAGFGAGGYQRLYERSGLLTRSTVSRLTGALPVVQRLRVAWDQLGVTWTMAGKSQASANAVFSHSLQQFSTAGGVIPRFTAGLAMAQVGIRSFGHGLGMVGKAITAVRGQLGKLTGFLTGRFFVNLAMRSFYSAFALSMLAGAAGGLAKSLFETAGAFRDTLATTKVYTGATEEQMAVVSKNLQLLGLEFPFGASTAADAMLELVKAGMDLNQAMTVLPNLLMFATNSEMELAEATKFVATSMIAYKIPVEEIGRVLDLYTTAAAESAIVDKDLADSLFSLVGRIDAAIVPLEDATTLITLLGLRGQMGAAVGTRLAASMRRLLAPGNEAKKVLEKLKLEIYDGTGAMRPFRDIITELITKLEMYSDETRNAWLQTLFGQRAMAVMGALLTTTAEEYDNLRDKIQKTGIVQELFNERMKELPVAQQMLSAAIETLQVNFGEKAAPAMAGFLHFIRLIIIALYALPDVVKLVIPAALVMLAVFAGLFSTIFIGLAIIASLISGLGALGLGFLAFGGAIATLAVAGFGVLLGYMSSFTKATNEGSDAVNDFAIQIASNIAVAAAGFAQMMMNMAKAAIQASIVIVSAFVAILWVINRFLDLMVSIFKVMGGRDIPKPSVVDWENLPEPEAPEPRKSPWHIVRDYMGEPEARGIGSLADALTERGDAARKAAKAALSHADATDQERLAAEADADAQEELAAGISAVDIARINAASNLLMGAFQTLGTGLYPLFSEMRGFVSQWYESLITIKEISEETFKDLLLPLISRLSGALQGVANGTMTVGQAWASLQTLIGGASGYIRDFIIANLELMQITAEREALEQRLADLERAWREAEEAAEQDRLEAERRLQDFRDNTGKIFNIFTWRRQKQLEDEAKAARRRAEDLRKQHQQERQQIKDELDAIKLREKAQKELVATLKQLGQDIIAMREDEAKKAEEAEEAKLAAAEKASAGIEKAVNEMISGISGTLGIFQKKFEEAFDTKDMQDSLETLKGVSDAMSGKVVKDWDDVSDAYRTGYDWGMRLNTAFGALSGNIDEVSTSIGILIGKFEALGRTLMIAFSVAAVAAALTGQWWAAAIFASLAIGAGAVLGAFPALPNQPPQQGLEPPWWAPLPPGGPGQSMFPVSIESPEPTTELGRLLTAGLTMPTLRLPDQTQPVSVVLNASHIWNAEIPEIQRSILREETRSAAYSGILEALDAVK